jgi:uncharacterized protein (DUF362 family)
LPAWQLIALELTDLSEVIAAGLDRIWRRIGTRTRDMLLSDTLEMRVAAARLPTAEYPSPHGSHDDIAKAILRLGNLLGWTDADSRRGAFGAVIPDGANVVVKPNWVLHENQGPWGLEPLLTHASVIRAVVEQALLARPRSVILGDAPLQGCDFARLLEATGAGPWAEQLSVADPRFLGVQDFRRTRCVFRNGVRHAQEDLVPLDQFVLFDLGEESLLEPVTTPHASFRVTQYNPEKLARTHRPGRHQYLIARAILDADVVLNLPKLKTHKKAGVTCALKNLIGINGNKEYLPHHRIGGSASGGDCYPGASRVKRALEFAYDRMNRTASESVGRGWSTATRVLRRVSVMQGDTLGVEGSWSGNDTVWRTCLDLNRILLYGRPDGTMADEPQRRVLNVVDAIVAGHGDGPLAPQPAPMGILLAGSSSAAVDRIGARLLGYDPSMIPIVREAAGGFRWRLVPEAISDVQLLGDLDMDRLGGLSFSNPSPLAYPVGWLDAVVPSHGRHAAEHTFARSVQA